MDAFLNQEYRAFFTKYLYHDYFDLIKNTSNTDLYNELLRKQGISSNLVKYFNKTENGFMQTILDVYEVLRFISIRYFMDNSRNGFTSDLIILNKLESAFYNLVEKRKINYLSIYLIFAFIISVYYWNGWKKYEVNFINLIKKSFDLINLIPEEIKNIIVLKLNE